jgi:hypothetical protein
MHVNVTIFNQLPLLHTATYSDRRTPWSQESLARWIAIRALELSYTAWDLKPLAIDFGWAGTPFRWNPHRRLELRCELDAAFFHLYRIRREEVAYILDTFPILRRNDENHYGYYRTKALILEIYDAMLRAIDSGTAYETIVCPPPADPRVAHPSAPSVESAHGREPMPDPESTH